jgi:hypothetical protein
LHGATTTLSDGATSSPAGRIKRSSTDHSIIGKRECENTARVQL